VDEGRDIAGICGPGQLRGKTVCSAANPITLGQLILRRR